MHILTTERASRLWMPQWHDSKLKLEIVSEGIEEKEQLAKLDELGIDYIQGYYFSKPRNAAEFISFIVKQ